MNENQYNPLEIHEGYIPKFLSWCKRKMRTIVTIGSLGLVLAGIQTYLAWASPDVAKEINKTIISTVEEYRSIDKVDIPDSILSNNEVQLLKSYQDEFELYMLFLMSLKNDEVVADNDTRLHICVCRLQTSLIYGKVCERLINLADSISSFEEKSNGNKEFNFLIDANLMIKAIELQKIVNNEQNKVIEYLKKHSVYAQSSEKGNGEFLKMLESILNSQNRLTLMQTQKELFKSIYIAVNIRLKQLINMDRRQKLAILS